MKDPDVAIKKCYMEEVLNDLRKCSYIPKPATDENILSALKRSRAGVDKIISYIEQKRAKQN
jgi:hypothetical protein